MATFFFLYLSICMLGNCSCFYFRLLTFFKIKFLKINHQGPPSECQTVCIQIKTYILLVFIWVQTVCMPGRVAQSVTCLATDACLTAYPGVASSIPVRSHTFVEIDHEIISKVILLPSAESFMKGCCQLQAKVCARLLVNCLFKLAQEKSVVR